MSDSAAFETACQQLSAATQLSGIEARGTVLIALLDANLQARTVSPRELAAVARKLLPKQLTVRGVKDADAVCQGIVDALAELRPAASTESPEAVFDRLGG